MLEKTEHLENSVRFCCIMGTWADVAVTNECVVHMSTCFVSVFVLPQWLSHRVRRQRGVSVVARSPAAPFPSLPSPQARRTCLFSTHASSVPVRPHVYSAAADRKKLKGIIHSKVKFLSSFIHSHAVLNQYDFRFFH